MPVAYYADEDCPGPVLRALRAAGLDVVSQREIERGVDDENVLRLSAMSGRVLITRDLGFGRLMFRDRLTANGVIIIRLRGPGDWERRAGRVVDAVKALGEGAVGHVATIDWHATRTRPFET